MFIEYYDKFDKSLANAWNDEMKPYINKYFPITKQGSFFVNSDLVFVIEIIDTYKEKYDNQKITSENKNNNIDINGEMNRENKTKINSKNNIEGKIINQILEKEEEKILYKSLNIFNKQKRRSTQAMHKELENKKFIENINNINKDEKINNNENDIQILRKQNISKIKKFLSEFLDENIIQPKRTNSMIAIRPHSQTVDSKTTCESSNIEEKLNLNLNKLISSNTLINDNLTNQNPYTNVMKNDKDFNINNDSNKAIDSNHNNTKNIGKKHKANFENMLIEGEGSNPKIIPKIKEYSKGQSISLLREMNPVFKDDIEEGNDSIAYKMPEKKLSYIFTDLLLKKIIYEDFIKNNILLIFHFCQQCFCFVNKEIFFRKVFSCYHFYKNKTSKSKLKNLIEFINILVIELFEYYQKIDMKDLYAIYIKKYYNELITDLILTLDIYATNNENNIIDENENIHNYRFESLDYYNNEVIKNRISIINENYIINKNNLINMNLNIEIKDIKIFFFKDKENKDEGTPQDPSDISKNSKSKTNPKPSLKSSLFSKTNKDKNSIKNMENLKKSNKSSKSVSFKDEKLVSPWILEENDEEEGKKEIKKEEDKKDDNNLKKEEKEKDDKKEDNNLEKEEKKEGKSIESTEQKGQKTKKQKIFQISKTLRKSQQILLKKTLKDIIIEEEEDQKEKSDEEIGAKSTKSLFSERTISENSISSSDDKGSDTENEKSNNSSSTLNFNRNESKDTIKEEVDNEQKLEIINNIIKTNNIPEKLITLNEKILDEIQYILILFQSEDGEPLYQDIKEAKEHISFYKLLQNIINKKKKTDVLPRQNLKRMTKSYSSIFNLGTLATKAKINARDYLVKGYFCITDWKTEEIGEQLMLISKSLLNKIYPRELYRAIFLKKDKEITSPNVVDCINKFNRLTSFIIDDIISYDFPKERARVYEKWVLIADFCKKNKDYNDLIAIFSALNNYIITGLNLTLKEVKGKINNILKQICDFCTVEGNYKNIREDMNDCEKRGIIFVPYLGMLMRDINFFEESSKYINEYGCINIEKIEKINAIFEIYFKFKNVPEKKSKIKELMFLEDLEDLTEEQLEEKANKLEPEFKIEDIQKPGKRPTNIDIKYFQKYKNKFKNSNFRCNNNIIGRKTISGGFI